MAPRTKKPALALKEGAGVQKEVRRSLRNQPSNSMSTTPEQADNTKPPPLFFYQTAGHFGCFSQWYRSDYSVPYNHFAYLINDDLQELEKLKALGENIEFCTAEQYMMFAKALLFRDHITAASVLRTEDPRKQKALGRSVQNFNDDKWKALRCTIVEKASVEKFRQNADARAVLFETGLRLIVEASPSDRIWGIGFRPEKAENTPRHLWGLNLLGKALMAAREELRADSHE